MYGTCKLYGRRAAEARAKAHPCHLPKNAYSHFVCHPKRNPISVLLASLILFLSSPQLAYKDFSPHTAPFVNSKSPMIFTHQWRSELDKRVATPIHQMPTCSYCSVVACRRLTALAPDTKVPANATPSAPSDQHWTKYLATSSRFCLAFD
ncbi:hypothetical protein V8C44DRAFT_336156 [Trichoderma aethiopicum]